MKKHLLKTMLTALILLVGGVNGAWAEATVIYGRALTADAENGYSAWSSADVAASGLNVWVGGFGYNETYGLYGSGTGNRSAVMTFSHTAKSIQTIDIVFNNLGNTGNANNYSYIKIGSDIEIQSNQQNQNGTVIINGTSSSISDCNQKGYNRGGDSWTIHVEINTAKNKVTALTLVGTVMSGKSANYTLASETALSNAATYNTVTIGFNRAASTPAAALTSIKIAEEEQATVPASYTINYVYGESIVKTEEGTSSVDATVNAELPITVDGQKYYAADGATTSIELVDGTNVLNVDLRKANEYTYSVSNNFGTSIASGTYVEGEPATNIYWSKYAENEGVWYECSESSYGVAVSETLDKTVNFTTASDITYFVECENMHVSRSPAASETGTGYSGGKIVRHYANSYWYTDALAGGIYSLSIPYWNRNSTDGTINIYLRDGEGTLSDTGISITGAKQSSGTITAEDIEIPDGYALVLNNTTEYNSNVLMDYVALIKTDNITVAAPTFSPVGGEYTEAQTVTLNCETEGATIYYSIDDNDPTTEYTTPIVISETTTIKAIAKIGDISSAVATATYTFKAAEEPTNIAVLPAADGWTIITALPENIGDYYYALVDNGGELMLSLARGNKQEDNYNSLYYKTAANALVDKSMLFTLESFDGSVVMTNAEYNGYFLQTEYEKANFYRTHDNGGGNKNWGKVNFVYSEDDRCWTVQNGQYAVENGNYLGVWDDNAAPANGKELALDKPANMKGTYRLYAISKADAETYHNKLKTLADYSEGNPVDMTALIVNPNAHFWTGSAPFGWTTTGVQNINKGEGPDGFPGIFEYSDWWASTWTGSLKQTIEVPNGVYELKAYFMAADGVTAYLTANNDKSENLTQFGADPRFPEQLSVRTTVTNGRIEIGAFAEASAVNRWVNTDNFTLTFIEGNPIEDYVTAYESALQNAISKKEAPMNVNVKSNLESVIAEYTGVNEENISELIVATAALQEAMAPVDVSIAAYADAKAALDAMKAVMDGTNVYTEEAFAAYNGVYTTKLAAYNDGTLTDDEAKAIENPEKTTGYRAANIVDNFLLSAWNTEPDFPEGVGYYINTWSTEGNGDGSNFTVPFFEYWTENVNSLGTKTMTATVEDLPEGLYGVRALVRVRVKNGATDAANGITLQVNDGTTTDVCAGEKVGSTQFVLKEYIASGIVGADGKMTVKLIVAEDNNISWLAFKNIKYFLMGDVNGEEGVTTTDAVMAIDFALEKSAPTFAQFAAADVNKSGDITVSDAVAIVNIALNEESVTEARSAEAGVNYLTMENSGIGLVNTTGFSAFQMDVTLSDGAVLSAARLTERAAGLILTSHQVGNNTWRIAALSLDGSTINGSEGALLNLDIAGQGSVSVSNVEFADRAARAYKLGLGTPTAISSLYNNKVDGEVYTVSGARSNGMKKGVNVVRRADGSVRKMLVK